MLGSSLLGTGCAVLLQPLAFVWGNNGLVRAESVVTIVKPTESLETILSTHTRSTKSVISEPKTLEVITRVTTAEHEVHDVRSLSPGSPQTLAHLLLQNDDGERVDATGLPYTYTETRTTVVTQAVDTTMVPLPIESSDISTSLTTHTIDATVVSTLVEQTATVTQQTEITLPGTTKTVNSVQTIQADPVTRTVTQEGGANNQQPLTLEIVSDQDSEHTVTVYKAVTYTTTVTQDDQPLTLAIVSSGDNPSAHIRTITSTTTPGHKSQQSSASDPRGAENPEDDADDEDIAHGGSNSMSPLLGFVVLMATMAMHWVSSVLS